MNLMDELQQMVQAVFEPDGPLSVVDPHFKPRAGQTKMAMAVAVTMAATAGTGGMKKVMGTNKAVAMVAVSPGIQPTKRPNKAEQKITSNT